MMPASACSSALSLGDHALQVVGWCYLLAWLLLSSAAAVAGVGLVIGWPQPARSGQAGEISASCANRNGKGNS